MPVRRPAARIYSYVLARSEPPQVSAATHLVVPYRQSAGGDRALVQAAGEAESSGRELTVLIPFVLPADSAACCGIRGEAWTSILRATARAEATAAHDLLARRRASVRVEVVEGASIPRIISSYMRANPDRLLALPFGGLRGPFPRSVARRIAKSLPKDSLVALVRYRSSHVS